ncbi:hypothetical protein FDP41_006193 [Naegleria fowleri]|uniref:Uncharacterized protein n=1 Tax=Naegleria fowleri TaxID=5763 RepID=A0A6A5BP71_NAEFO|nr:uncharacterized protein FDP41_006193 [Naegleria fowleri]KAF0974719.1 hypothetical protein FDP41_006193 [Naegleria fowleri]
MFYNRSFTILFSAAKIDRIPCMTVDRSQIFVDNKKVNKKERSSSSHSKKHMKQVPQVILLFIVVSLLVHSIKGGLYIPTPQTQETVSSPTLHDPIPLVINMSHSSSPQSSEQSQSPSRSSKDISNTKDTICCYEPNGLYQYCPGISICCRSVPTGCTGSFICAPYGSTCCGTGYCSGNSNCATCGSSTGCLPYGATCCGSGYCNSGYTCTSTYQCQLNTGGGGGGNSGGDGNGNNNGGSSGGLGTGGIAGIAAGSSVGGLILVGIIGGIVALCKANNG